MRLFEPSPKQSKEHKTNSERSKEYRERLKKDPEKLADYKSKYQERNKQNRQKTVTDEELQRRRELNRLRVQRFRANQKRDTLTIEQTPKKNDVAGPIVTRLQRQQEEASVIARRAQWRKHKQAQRERWSSQKKRRNRQCSLAWYHATKTRVTNSLSGPPPQKAVPEESEKGDGGEHATQDNVQEQDCPSDTQENLPETETMLQEGNKGDKAAPKVMSKNKKKMWAEKKALYRAKQALSKFKANVLQELMKFIMAKTKTCSQQNVTADAMKVKNNLDKEIEKLNPKRSKESLKSKKFLLHIIEGEEGQRKVGTYKRTKSQKNLKLQEFFEDVSVNLPGKKTVGKRSLTQKKIFPKRVRHLQKDFEGLNPSIKVSRSTFYRNIPNHILTSNKHKHRSCLCEVCIAVDQKLDVLNKHLSVPIDGRDSLSDLSLCSQVSLDCLTQSCLTRCRTPSRGPA